jgi:putative ABC transport system permease protein
MMALVRESLATAWAQPVASVVTIVIVAGMCATVLLTTGRTVGAEQSVLGSIDSAGTRSIVIRAEADAGLDASVLDRLANLDGIEWAGAFGPATDATNAAVPDGTKVPIRLAWGTDLQQLGIPAVQPVVNRTAWASTVSLEQLGMPDSIGGVITGPGDDYAVAGSLTTPDYLRFLEPLIVVPQNVVPQDAVPQDAVPHDAAAPAPVSVLVVVASRPDLVAPVSQAVQSVLAVDDPTKVKLSTSEQLAALRALIEGQLGSFGRNLVIIVFAITALLVAAILYGLVMLRRKDFGRRRALGASQGLIIGLLLVQVAALASVGTLLGSIGATIGLTASGDPLPGIDFIVSVCILATAVSVIAAIIPALAAARRDPLTELRVP